MNTLDFHTGLNPEQHEAVVAPFKPLLILAGAGSGKTRVLTHRVAHMIQSGVAPQSIMLVTFTNRAAGEMMRRIAGLCGDESRLVVGGTFHHIALIFLRKYAHVLGYGRDFTLIDRDDAKDAMNQVVKENLSPRIVQHLPKANVLLDMVSLSLNTQRSIHDVVRSRGLRFYSMTDDIAKICRLYMQKKIAMNVMDFDDLLVNWQTLLKEHDEVAHLIRNDNKALLVDEYQDTNALQSDIIDLMAKHHQNITVVGDDAQSIYGFRGADVYNMLSFLKRYSSAQQLTLATNYRSTPQILELANHSLKFAKEGFKKELQSIKAPGAMPHIVACGDGKRQAQYVVQRIMQLKRNGVSLNDIAVLYRAHSHALELQLELLHQQMPFVVRSGIKFFEQAHVKDIVAHIKLAYNPKDEMSFLRALKLREGIGPKTAQQLWQGFCEALRVDKFNLEYLLSTAKGKKIQQSVRSFYELFFQLRLDMQNAVPSQLIRVIMQGFYDAEMERLFTNAKERKEDIVKLADFADGFATLEDFMTELSLVMNFIGEDAQHEEYGYERITLSSIHQAKGLEWNHVFVVWLNEGKFPSEMSINEENGIEEERRLMYVALTRARDTLTLSHVNFFLAANGNKYYLAPSRFLGEMNSLQLFEPKFERVRVDAHA